MQAFELPVQGFWGQFLPGMSAAQACAAREGAILSGPQTEPSVHACQMGMRPQPCPEHGG